MIKLLKSFSAIFGLTVLIQVFGLLRSVFLSKDLGASMELDAFYLANVLTVSVFSIITSSISTVLIPSIIKEKGKSKTSSLNYLISIMRITLGVSLILFLLLFFFVDKINPNFTNNIQKTFLFTVLVLLIGQFFRILSTYFMSKLQISEKYFISRFPNVIPALFPLVYLLFTDNFRMVIFVSILASSYVAELLMYFILGDINIRKIKLSAFFLSSKKDKTSRNMLKNTLPILIGSTLFQLQIIITNYLAGYFGKGYITILSNTNQIVGIFQGLLVANIFTLVYPRIVGIIKGNLLHGLKKVEDYIIITNFIVILLVWGYAAVGNDLVKLLFYRGNFTLESSNKVYIFGLLLMLGLPFSVIRDYFYRVYYAIDNTAKPTRNTIITVIFNICLLFLLKFVIQEFSLVVSISIGTLFSLINISFQMRKDNFLLNWKRLLSSFILTNVLASIMFVAIKLFGINTENSLNNLLVNIPLGVLVIGISMTIIFFLFRNSFNLPDIH